MGLKGEILMMRPKELKRLGIIRIERTDQSARSGGGVKDKRSVSETNRQASAGTKRACWGDGTDGWEPSRLAGRARAKVAVDGI